MCSLLESASLISVTIERILMKFGTGGYTKSRANSILVRDRMKLKLSIL